MSELVVDGIRLALAGPDSLPLAAVRRGSPSYDPERGFFTVSLKNESGRRRILPFDELRRSVVLVYRNPSTGQEIIDNRTPPPKRDGAVEGMSPGETKTFQVVFDYPESIATFHDHVARLRFCVRWENRWLRAATYAPGAYDWNESFEVCREVGIVDQ